MITLPLLTPPAAAAPLVCENLDPPPPHLTEMQSKLESNSSENYLPCKALSFFGSRACRRSAGVSILLTPPFRLDTRRTSTLKSPISSTLAIPLGVVLAWALSQQWVDTVTVPSFPLFAFGKEQQHKQQGLSPQAIECLSKTFRMLKVLMFVRNLPMSKYLQIGRAHV